METLLNEYTGFDVIEKTEATREETESVFFYVLTNEQGDKKYLTVFRDRQQEISNKEYQETLHNMEANEMDLYTTRLKEIV